MKLCTVVGARPQFIKASALSKVLRQEPNVNEVLIHTGQHYDENLSDVFFEELGIDEPDYNLKIGSETHGAQTGRMLESIEKVLFEERPDVLLLYGDTNSTLSGALAGSKMQIPIAHVEAGLRSFNMLMPEEINRKLTDQVSDFLFAPTESAVNNLQQEGLPRDKIHLVGDIMYDCALSHCSTKNQDKKLLSDLSVEPGGYVLATVHRAENTDSPHRLAAIFEGLADVARQCPVILPLHPRTRSMLKRYDLLDGARRSLCLVEPLGYLQMLALERNAQLIVTDSGGIQKEAFFHRVPCVTLRDETEWVELVDHGWNKLVAPLDADVVCRGILGRRAAAGEDVALYGDGKTAERILNALKRT